MKLPSSRTARLAAWLGVGGALLAGVGLAGAFTSLLQPMQGFGCFGLGILAGLLAIPLGAFGLFRTRPSAHRSGAGQAWLGLAAGCGLALVLLSAGVPGRGVPRINDITTDPDDPPKLQAAAEQPPNQGRDLSYPGDVFARAQRAAYPDIAPILVFAPFDETVARVRAVADELGWEITRMDAKRGELEAMQTSFLFRFVDDIAVRVRPRDGGSLVDVRSKSRDGKSDLGANAHRIRAFAQKLKRGA